MWGITVTNNVIWIFAKKSFILPFHDSSIKEIRIPRALEAVELPRLQSIQSAIMLPSVDR